MWSPNAAERPRAALRPTPDLAIEISIRRNLVYALQALQRDELDVAFGNIANLPHPLPPDLHADLICFTKGMALVHRDGPFGAIAELHPESLSTATLWMPLTGSSSEVADFMQEYARSLGMRVLDTGVNIGVESLVEGIVADQRLLALVDAGWPLPPDTPLRRVPIRPVPLFPW